MSDDPLDPRRITVPAAESDRMQLILEGIEQVVQRIADVLVRCDELAHGVATLDQRLLEVERRLDTEMLRRVETEAIAGFGAGGTAGRGVPGLPEPLDPSVKG